MADYTNYIRMSVYVAVILTLLYFWIKKKLNYWTELQVPTVYPTLKFNDFVWMYYNENRFVYFRDLYYKSAPHKFAGYYFGLLTPTMLIRDPELIKAVLVKQFANFTQKSPLIPEKNDPVFQFLINLNGREWRQTRKNVVPAFSSGKIKHMFPIMFNTAMELTHSIVGTSENKSNKVDMKIASCRYILDMLFSSMYKVDAQTAAEANYDFVRMARHLLNRTQTVVRLNFWLQKLPRLSCYLGGRVIDQEAEDFYQQKLLESVKLREEEDNGSNVDFLQYFLNSSKSRGFAGDSDKEYSKQWFFESAVLYTSLCAKLGSSTITAVMCCALYEIAKNPTVQAKLHEEIRQQMEQSNGRVHYDDLPKMNYLRKFLFETFRKYPTTPEVSRVCSETCVLSGTDFTCEKGTRISISVSGLHYDPQYYPDPEKFDPERFTEEEKEARDPYVYIPFGAGPRMCIAERFVKLLLEAAIISLLSKYTITLPDDIDTVEFEPRKFLTTVKNIQLQFTENTAV